MALLGKFSGDAHAQGGGKREGVRLVNYYAVTTNTCYGVTFIMASLPTSMRTMT